MGNRDGLMSAMASSGMNEVMNFEGGYFSFAYGDEIALVLNGDYYILNCSSSLWEKVNEFMEGGKSLAEITAFWKEKAKSYKKSDWSDNFEDI